MKDSEFCEFLQWDSDFFGFRIARIIGHRLTRRSLSEILEWAANESIVCLYFLSDFDDLETIRLAQAHEFQLVDIRIAFEIYLEKRNGSFPTTAAKAKIRPFRAEDIPILEAIAKSIYTATRFYFDPNFPRDKTEALYAAWIRRSCEGLSDQILVAELDGKIVGYITCKQLDETRGQIDLVGVAKQARGQGVGKALVQSALDWFNANNLQSVQVVTQGRNILAQQLFQSCGFFTHSVRLWYHKWTPAHGSPAW
jgi:dTDP-4-amino-4,6-dideoxy-D-galactose acyltransferase